ncbi:MAG TPA: hypothetical protein VFV10_06115 [Gammaproteobacteria bacterium]|nr:hypothetical protein [Gammaproteobacteria bacterium]
MTPFLKTAAEMLVLAAAAAAFGRPPAAFSQPAFGAREQAVVAAIDEEQAQNGPNSKALIAPLTALALLYEEKGDYALSTAATRRALEVVRVNYGLHSLDQAPLLEQAVRNEQARGDAGAAWNLEQELLGLVERHPGDLQTVPILHEIADERMKILGRYYVGDFPPEIVLGCYYGENCHAGSRGKVIESLLGEAKGYYAKAIDVLLENDRYASEEFRELVDAFLRGSYLYGHYLDVGDVLGRVLAYESAHSSSVASESRIETLVRIGDWDVLLAGVSNRLMRVQSDDDEGGGRAELVQEPYDYDAVLDVYEQAYARLMSEHAPQASIDAVFAPTIPTVLPTVMPNPLATAPKTESAPYVDVAFEITKYGKSRHVEVRDRTANATRAQERELMRLIRTSTFRPRMVAGRFADSAPVTLRYYFDE